jgi:hypothetical protein
MNETLEKVESPYVAPNELALRWQCARSSVDRIARLAGLTRLCLGDGKNGMVLYVRKEVEAYETQRRSSVNPERRRSQSSSISRLPGDASPPR